MLFDMTLKGGNDISRATDPRLVLEMLLLRMVSAPKVQSLAQLIGGGGSMAATGSPKAQSSTTGVTNTATRQGTTAPRAQQQTAPSPQKPTQAAAAPAQTATQNTVQNTIQANSQTSEQALPQENKKPITAQAVQITSYDNSKPENENWFTLVQGLKTQNAMMAAKLENTHVVSLTGDQLTLGLPEALQFLHDQFKSESFMAQLNELLQKNWNKKFKISVKLVGKNSDKGAAQMSPKEQAKKKAEAKEQQVREQVENHPLVQSAQKKLNAKIDSITDMNNKS